MRAGGETAREAGEDEFVKRPHGIPVHNTPKAAWSEISRGGKERFIILLIPLLGIVAIGGSGRLKFKPGFARHFHFCA